MKAADAFLHQQDHAEIDLLDSLDYAAYEGGFAAAADRLGNTPALYHTDISRPDAPKVRTLVEEIARIVRGRAANPAWIEGMMRHGYRGAAEVTRSVEGLFAFAATLPARLDRQFDVLFDATLGNETRRQLSCARRIRKRAKPWPRASTKPSAAICGARAGTAWRALREAS